LAIIKFSASIKIVGQYMHRATKPHDTNTTPNKSLKENRGLKLTLSRYLSTPIGFLEPLE
jgi:hypothetical protein